MIESIILSTMLAYANPSDPSGTTIYPSGIKDNGDFIFSAPPACLYPLIKNNLHLNLRNGNKLTPEIYCIKPSTDEKKIFIMQGHKTLCECPIIENTIVGEFAAKPTTRIIKNDKGYFLIYHIENVFKKAKIPVIREN